MRRRVFRLFLLTLGSALAASGQDWGQWGRNAQHTGSTSAIGQSARHVLADVVYDPFTEQEQADPLQADDLLVHYQSPLIDGNDVYMEFKSGAYTTLDHWETQNWNEKRLRWSGGSLVPQWSFQSDWKPVPYSFSATGPAWEPVFHAVLAGSYIYVPGAGGTIFKLNKLSGTLVARINPFGTIDGDTFSVGPPAADGAGNVYYNVMKLVHGNAWNVDVVNSWLVKVSANGTAQKVSFHTLTDHVAPDGNDKCAGVFDNADLPWPPSPDAIPAKVQCGSQRPGVNSSPAVAPDGTIYTVSLAHLTDRTSFLIAVNPNLTRKWAASLRGHLFDGCNVQIPPTGTPGGCRAGAHDGVEPRTNQPGAGRVLDDSTSAPVVLPDGAVIYGAYTGYNYAQGHLMKFSANGTFLGAYQFGWDLTPTVWQHGGTYSIIMKENHYTGGSYCGDDTFCPPDRTANHPSYPEAYYITQLSKDLVPEWQYQNTNPLACSRQPDGTITCTSGDHPHGFEWCVNAAVVDGTGSVFVNSEDGGLYVLRQGGTLKDHLFLNLAIGAAYTPLSMGNDGKIYTQNDGHLFVVGR